MSIINALTTAGVIGNKLASLLGGENATPMSGDIIPTATLHKGQKLFSSNESIPNLPKPKTLYFVYFSLNPELGARLDRRKALIEMLSDNKSKTVEYNTQTLTNKYTSSAMATLSDFTKVKGSGSSDFADTILTKDAFVQLSYEISKMVKAYTKPKISFKTKSFNEYNRKRLIYDKIEYSPISITFYDVKENPVQQMFLNYIKMINNDFFCKNDNVWQQDISNNMYMNANGYKDANGATIKSTYLGNYNSFGLSLESNFRLIDKISFCEYYQNKMMVYTIEKPVITDIDFGDSKMGDFSSNDLKITFDYEGITNDLINTTPYNVAFGKKINQQYLKSMINADIKPQVGPFLQTKYYSTTASVGTDLMNIIKSYINGEKKFNWTNVKNNILDTGRKYGFATEINNAVQLNDNINAYLDKDGSDKWKFLVNASTDPTTIIGRTSKATQTSNLL